MDRPGLESVEEANQTLSEIHSCISIIEQAAGLPFDLIIESGDLPFQMCNMGGELISIEALTDSIRQAHNPTLLDEPVWHTREAWISLQSLIAQG